MELSLFFGRFHPLLVHLPIGFLMLASIIELTEHFKITKGLKVAVPFTLLIGFISGTIACILGLLLAGAGDYNEDTLSYHKWAGILTTISSLLAYGFSKNWLKGLIHSKAYPSLICLLFLGLTVTGHLGGNMTHGSGYLTEYMPFLPKKANPLNREKVTDLAKAELFADIVHPIVKDKCMSCHNEEKKKGGLSFSTIEGYKKGGKSGNTIIPDDALKSELLVRVNLDSHHEDFMPTDDKTPLTEEEKTLITYWIANTSANYDSLFLATKPDEKTIALASEYLQVGLDLRENIKLPPVDANNIANLKKQGFTIREMAVGSNAFDVVLTSKNGATKDKLFALMSIKDNILWLTLEDVGLQNQDLITLSKFKSLSILKISKNNIGDDNMEVLTALENLESINLYQTNITSKSVQSLVKLPKLKRLYVWQTKINSEQILALQGLYSNVELIGGI
jgi:uncharacterized membrane protein